MGGGEQGKILVLKITEMEEVKTDFIVKIKLKNFGTLFKIKSKK